MTCEGLVVTYQQLVDLLSQKNWGYTESQWIVDVLEKEGLVVVRRSEIEKNAKTLSQVVNTCDFIRNSQCKSCFGQCEFEGTEHFKGKWVRVDLSERARGPIWDFRKDCWLAYTPYCWEVCRQCLVKPGR
jgi:hypothetical protein